MNYKSAFGSVACACVGISAIAFASTKATAATLFWDLDLLDETGAEVGTVEFSYDPETVENLSAFGINGVSGFSSFTETNVLDSFTLNLLEAELSINPDVIDFWWNENSANAMQQLRSENFGDVVGNGWSIPDGFAIPALFQISGSSTETTGQGTWSFADRGFASGTPFASLEGLSISGTWNGALRGSDDSTDPGTNGGGNDSDNPVATPESSTVFGLLALAGMGLAVTKKKSC